MKKRLGIVGLGRMGANMARRLKDCGYPIAAVFDTKPETTKQLAEELGAFAAKHLAEVSERSEVILTVVSDDASMHAIFDPSTDSLLSHASGKIFINCATISPKVHEEVEAWAKSAGAQTLEACMASSIPQAREGTLILLVAGERSVFEKAEPILKDLSRSLRYIGSTGQAAKVKALVNMVMNINTAGLAEGLALGDALGLDLTVLREVFALTGANSRVLETDGEDMQNRDHDCYFSAAHAAKDSGIAVDLAESTHIEVPLAKATLHQYRRMVDLGLGEWDKSGIAEIVFKGRLQNRKSPDQTKKQ